jgi:hypothetical protein
LSGAVQRSVFADYSYSSALGCDRQHENARRFGQHSLTTTLIRNLFALLIFQLFSGHGAKTDAGHEGGTGQNGGASKTDEAFESDFTLATGILDGIRDWPDSGPFTK